MPIYKIKRILAVEQVVEIDAADIDAALTIARSALGNPLPWETRHEETLDIREDGKENKT